MSDKIRVFYERASHLLAAIQAMTTGAKATLVLRFPGFPEQDILLTDDDLDEAIALIRRRQEAGRQFATLAMRETEH